ncbi:MAG: hypothetical protein FWH17_01520 [Oscillospiraceae bacterium]|nr:hypothetical protein [Oscillospiraceae bacterium]
MFLQNQSELVLTTDFGYNITHHKAVIKFIPRAEHGCGASEPSAQG